MSNNICLFSSYFLTPEIPYYIKYYLQQLRPFFNEIVFITNNDKTLDESSMNWLRQNVENILWVQNEGMDFGMWQKAIKHLPPYESIDNLALINDSCICFKSLDNYFTWHDSSLADVTGMVMSNECSRHLQSFFLVAKQKAIASIIAFLEKVDISKGKYKEIVQVGEIGLTQYLEKEGIIIAAKFDVMGSNDENPSFVYCSKLLVEGMPLIKRKLFRYPSNRLIQKGINLGIPFQTKKFAGQIESQVGEELTQKLLPQVKFSVTKEIRLYRRILKFYIIRLIVDIKNNRLSNY